MKPVRHRPIGRPVKLGAKRLDGLNGPRELLVHGNNEGWAFKGSHVIVEDLLNGMRPSRGGKFFQMGKVGGMRNQIGARDVVTMPPPASRFQPVVRR